MQILPAPEIVTASFISQFQLDGRSRALLVGPRRVPDQLGDPGLLDMRQDEAAADAPDLPQRLGER